MPAASARSPRSCGPTATDRSARPTGIRSERLCTMRSSLLGVLGPLLFLPFYLLQAFSVPLRPGVASAASPWKGVLARLKVLLIPYLIWSTVIFIGDALQGDIYRPAEYLWRLLTVGAVGPYFYIPLLCYCTLLAPLIVPAVKAACPGLDSPRSWPRQSGSWSHTWSFLAPRSSPRFSGTRNALLVAL